MRKLLLGCLGLGLALAARSATADDPRTSQPARDSARAVNTDGAADQVNHLKVRKGFKMFDKTAATRPQAMNPGVERTQAVRNGAVNTSTDKQTRTLSSEKDAAAAATPTKVVPGEKVNKLNPARAARMRGMMRSMTGSAAGPTASSPAAVQGSPVNAHPPTGASG